MSAHSSNGFPDESFREYRLLTTFLALIPSCCDFRRGETVEMAGTFPIFLPTVALIISAFQKIVIPKRIATQAFNLDVFWISRLALQHRAERNILPFQTSCQYIVGIFFRGPTKCIFAADLHGLTRITWMYQCSITEARNCRYRGCGCRVRQTCLTSLRASAWSWQSSRSVARNQAKIRARVWVV